MVYNPVLDELFTACQGQGAWLQSPLFGQQPHRLHVTDTRNLGRALVLTEMGYDRSPDGVAAMLQRIERLLRSAKVQGFRSMGSCALNMCYVAAGRLDLYYEGKDSSMGPKPWDMAAAMLIVHEAGGITADPSNGSPLDFTSGRVLAANSPQLLASFLECINSP